MIDLMIYFVGFMLIFGFPLWVALYFYYKDIKDKEKEEPQD